MLNNELKVGAADIHEFGWLSARKLLESKRREAGPLEPGYDVRIDFGHYLESDFQGKFLVDVRTIVVNAIESSVAEVKKVIVGRTLRHTLETTKALVVKDFCVYSDEHKFLAAAQALMSNLTWNLVMVTSREPMRASMNEYLEGYLNVQTELDDTAKKLVRESLVSANLDIACASLRKIVVDASLAELAKDTDIIKEIKRRQQSKDEKKPFANENFQKIQRDLPKLLKPRMDAEDLDFIEIYNGSISFLSTKDEYVPETHTDASAPFALANANFSDEELALNYLKEVEKEMKNPKAEERLKNFSRILYLLNQHIQKNKNPELTALKVAQSFFALVADPGEGGPSPALDVLQVCAQHAPKLPAVLVKWIFDAELYLDPIFMVSVLQKSLIRYQDFDEKFSQKLQTWSSKNITAVGDMFKEIIVHDRIFPIFCFPKIIRQLLDIAKSDKLNTLSEETQLFIQSACNYVQNQTQENSLKLEMVNMENQYIRLTSLVREFFSQVDDALLDEAESFLSRWLGAQGETEAAEVVGVLKARPFLEDERQTKIFFSYLIDMCVERTHRANGAALAAGHNTLDYSFIDGVCRFFIHFASPKKEHVRSEYFLEKILMSMIIVFTKNHNFATQVPFDPRIYYRLLHNLITFSGREGLQSHIAIYAQTLKIIQPLKYPRFCFAWLGLISQNFLLSAINAPASETMVEYLPLFLGLVTFYREVFSAELMGLADIRLFYVGTLRFLLVLQNDFPDFLTQHAFELLEDLPPYLKQLRNVVLSTFPRNMKPPIPFGSAGAGADLKEYRFLPPLSQRVDCRINSHNLQLAILTHLKSKGADDVGGLVASFYNTTMGGRARLNAPLVRSFIFFLPHLVYRYYQNSHLFYQYRDQSFNLLYRILRLEHFELNEKMIGAVMDNLTYPNHVTFYYAQLVLSLFNQLFDEKVAEQCLRHLYDRLMVDKPHPWGVLHLFSNFLATSLPLLLKRPFYREIEKPNQELIRIVGKYVQIDNMADFLN